MDTSRCEMGVAVLFGQCLRWVQVAVIWVWQFSLDNKSSMGTSRCDMGVAVLFGQ